jgi:hypothetical protein
LLGGRRPTDPPQNIPRNPPSRPTPAVGGPATHATPKITSRIPNSRKAAPQNQVGGSRLRSIFGFVGVTDLQFISAQPMDVAPDLRETALAAAVAQVEILAGSPGWAQQRVLGDPAV